MAANQIFKTRPPFNVLLLGLIILTLILFSISNPVWLIYAPLMCAIFYVFFCRYCCIITITENQVIVKYIAPWNKTVIVYLSDIGEVNYEKGYYDMFSDKPISRVKAFLRYPYDKMIINLRDKSKLTVYLNVNTRMFDFDKVLKILAVSKATKTN